MNFPNPENTILRTRWMTVIFTDDDFSEVATRILSLLEADEGTSVCISRTELANLLLTEMTNEMPQIIRKLHSGIISEEEQKKVAKLSKKKTPVFVFFLSNKFYAKKKKFFLKKKHKATTTINTSRELKVTFVILYTN